MGVMAPRSHCPGEDGNPLRGDGRHPVQRETSIVSQPVRLTGSGFSASGAARLLLQPIFIPFTVVRLSAAGFVCWPNAAHLPGECGHTSPPPTYGAVAPGGATEMAPPLTATNNPRPAFS